MKGTTQRLRAELDADRNAFEVRVDELSGIDLDGPISEAVLARAAVALHHAYSAVEAIMLRAARFFEGEEPRGPDRHQSLLASMGLELDGIRGRVFHDDTLELLQCMLAFRHFFSACVRSFIR
ncbi:MAG: hypothetical protein V3T05_02720 [Myxococcota bacterium]